MKDDHFYILRLFKVSKTNTLVVFDEPTTKYIYMQILWENDFGKFISLTKFNLHYISIAYLGLVRLHLWLISSKTQIQISTKHELF